MARKGRKTRWRKLPIPIGAGQGGGSTPTGEENHERRHQASPPSCKEHHARVTFNEDEYTKITTPRQDMLFKKGYLGRKKNQEPTNTYQEAPPPHSPAESVESEYMGCEERVPMAPVLYPSGYLDHNGLLYVNGPGYEVYDPYTGSVTVIVGSGGYPGQPVVVPCQPVPLQPLDWFPPQPLPHSSHYNPYKKRNSTDSQNWGSSPGCESPPSPQEGTQEAQEPLFYPQYIYPGYMFPPPLYTLNGMSVPAGAAAAVPPAAPPPLPADPPKRRKKRRKKRRAGMGEEGSESSCEEQGGSGGSGGSSDVGQGSSCSKTTDSGVHTANSGADSPQPVVKVSDSASDSAESQPQVQGEVAAGSNTEGSHTGNEESEEEAVRNGERVECDLGTVNRDLGPVDSEEEDNSTPDHSVPPPSSQVTQIEQGKEEITVELKTNSSEHLSAPELNEAEERLIIEQANEEQNESPEITGDVESLSKPSEACSQSPPLLAEVRVTESEGTEGNTETEEKTAEADGWSTAEDAEEKPDSIDSPLNSSRGDDSTPAESDEQWNNAEEVRSSGEGSEVRWGAEEWADEADDRWQCAETELGTDALADKPITEAVTRWLEAQGSLIVAHPPDSDEELPQTEDISLTGQKNGPGNPFPVPYHSGAGTRVAVLETQRGGEESGPASVWERCEARASVHRYYRLGADSPPPLKTAAAAIHLHPDSPFPCGLVCCILQ